MICVCQLHGDKIHIIYVVTKRYFIKVAPLFSKVCSKMTGAGHTPIIDFISHYATEARYALAVSPSERGSDLQWDHCQQFG